MEEASSSNGTSSRPITEKKAWPQEQLNCPRCNSNNTKFCYYNNYSLTQPRYFCKTCRRYWTEGGSLRNVPVGGGSRKNKRLSSSLNISKLPDLNPPSISQFSSQNPKIHDGQDLNLSFPTAMQENQGIPYFLEVPKTGNSNVINTKYNNSSSSSYKSAREILRTGISSRGLNSFFPTPMPDSNTVYSSGFTLQESKPSSLSFAVEGLGVEENGGRILFPLGELKNLSSSTHHLEVDQNKGQGNITTTTSATANGFWHGMFSGNGGPW